MIATDPTAFHLCDERVSMRKHPRNESYASICSVIESATYFTGDIMAKASEYTSIIRLALVKNESVKICLNSRKVVLQNSLE